MSTTKRNRALTLSEKQKIDRTYRRVLEIDRNMKRTMKTLADDFTRVIRQNDTLRAENAALKEPPVQFPKPKYPTDELLIERLRLKFSVPDNWIELAAAIWVDGKED